MPDAPGLELIRGEIEQSHPGAVLDTCFDHGQAALVVDPAQILAVLGWLRDSPGQEYRFLSSLHVADYLPAEPRFGVHYELLNRDRVERLRVKAMLADPGARRRSCPRSTPASSSSRPPSFQEREVYDFFGIVFRGHPDLTRILLPDDYVGWPQRRDFPVGGEPVIFTHNEREASRGGTSERRADRRDARAAGGARTRRDARARAEVLTINIGPHHPATHGVLRLLVDLEGEVVRDLKPVIGYVHTGIEKSCEDKCYWKVIPFVERMDYLSYFFNMEAFCGAVERLRRARDPAARQVPAGDPPRAQPDPLPPGLARDDGARPRRDLDALVLLPRARQDPRPVRDGDRAADAHPLLPGRRRLRGHPARLRGEAARVLRRDADPGRPVRGAPRPQRDLPPAHQGRRDRLPRAAARARRHRPAAARRGRALGPAQGFDYLAYADFDFKIPVGTVGDGYDRYRVRLAEMRESVRIIEQALDGLPEGPCIADDRKYVLPPRSELSTSMEALIHHFKLVTEGFRVPPGEVYYAIESPARRARLLRARRRLREAGPGPHPRPLVRQPAGASRHVRSAATSPT